MVSREHSEIRLSSQWGISGTSNGRGVCWALLDETEAARCLVDLVQSHDQEIDVACAAEEAVYLRFSSVVRQVTNVEPRRSLLSRTVLLRKSTDVQGLCVIRQTKNSVVQP